MTDDTTTHGGWAIIQVNGTSTKSSRVSEQRNSPTTVPGHWRNTIWSHPMQNSAD